MKFLSSLVKPKNALRVLEKQAEIAKIVKEKYGFLDWSKSKFQADVLEMIANLIEAEFNSNKKAQTKVNKKELLLNIVSQFISLTEEDKRVIGETVDFLHNTGRIRLPSLKRKTLAISSWFLKK